MGKYENFGNNRRRKACFKPCYCILIIVCIVLLTPQIAAFEFDNVLRTEKIGKYDTLHIDNAFGLGERIATLELKENSDYCLDKCYAIIEVTLFKDETIFNDFDFISSTNKKRELNYDITYWEEWIEVVDVPTYKEECSQVLNKNNSKYYEVCNTVFDKDVPTETLYGEWKDYDGKVMLSGTYQVKLEGTKDVRESIDWAFEYIGISKSQVRDSWAWWDAYSLSNQTLGLDDNVLLRASSNLTLDLDENGNAEIMYLMTGDNSSANYIFYNNENVTAFGTEATQYFMAQTQPTKRVEGSVLGASGLIAAYPMDEKVDNATGFTNFVNFNHSEMSMTDGDGGFEKGFIGEQMFYGINQTGTTSYLFIPKERCSLAMEVGSYCLWTSMVHGTDNTLYQHWFGVSNGATHTVASSYEGEQVKWRIGTTIVIDLGASNFMTANEFAHICFTWSDNTYDDNYTIWKNGALYANSVEDSAEAVDADCRIGNSPSAYGGGNDAIYGKYFDIQMYNRSLTGAEVRKLYNAGTSLTGGMAGAIVVNIVYPANTTYNSQTLDLKYTTDADDSCLYSLDEWVTNSTRQNPAVNWTGLPANEGNNHWLIYCNDSVRPSQTDEVHFTVDTVAPNLTLSAPTNTTYWIDYATTNSTNVVMNWSVGLDADTCWYNNYNGTGNTTVTCFDNGTIYSDNFSANNVTFYVNDSNNNVNISSVSFTNRFRILENTKTFNETTYETKGENYTVNVDVDSSYASVTASFWFNDTNYSMTSVGSDPYTFSNNFGAVPLLGTANAGENISLIWNFALDGTEYNSTTYYQYVAPINITNCSSGGRYINVTFVDEDDLAKINATAENDWQFSLATGDNSVYRTSTYLTANQNLEYNWCFLPADKSFDLNGSTAYGAVGYPQRDYNHSGTYTNGTTNVTVYLLSSSDGIYSTFQVLNYADQPLTGVFATGERQISGVWTRIAYGSTGDDGGVTFWVNPDYSHRFTFSKRGYTDVVNTITPTQSQYTVYMGDPTAGNQSYDFNRGIWTKLAPLGSELTNNTFYVFNFTITSNYWDLEEWGFSLKNSSGTNILSKNSSTVGTGGVVTANISTLLHNDIVMEYYWNIAGNWSNTSRTWMVVSEDKGYGIKTFATHLKSYVDDGIFGLNDFSLTLILFFFIFVIIGIVATTTGTYNVTAISVMLFGLVALFDVVLGLFPTLPNAAPYFPTIFTAFVLIIALFREAMR